MGRRLLDWIWDGWMDGWIDSLGVSAQEEWRQLYLQIVVISSSNLFLTPTHSTPRIRLLLLLILPSPPNSIRLVGIGLSDSENVSVSYIARLHVKVPLAKIGNVVNVYLRQPKKVE